jgi:subtilisin family serine protease
MSFGGGPPNGGLFDAFEYARNAGVILVAAGDNEPDPDAGLNYPAQWIQNEGSGPNIDAGRGLVVTMAKHDGTRNIHGQRNKGVSVAAFGSATDTLSGGQQGILSTWPPALPVPPQDDTLLVRTTVDGDNRYAYLVGTSMATPQVAGLAALIRSVRPSMPAERVVRLIKLTADGKGDYGRGVGWGIIDAYPAVAAALGRDITPPGSRVRWARVAGASASARRPVLRLRLKRFDRHRLGMPTSGVRAVNVFVSVDGGPYRRFRKTRRKRIRFRGRAGREYSFYTRAVDRAGNREPAPGKPDVSLSLTA